MGLLKTCCGFYCSMTALVGVYFFIVLAIMEYRGNFYLTQIVQNVEDEHVDGKLVKSEQISSDMKGTAFLITAAVQAVLVVICYFCGVSSLKEDQDEEDKEMRKHLGAYQRLDNQDPNQIISN